MHPRVGLLILVLLSQVLRAYGPKINAELSPVADRPMVVQALARCCITKSSLRLAQLARDLEGRLEYIGAVQDVTERMLSEEALARSRLELAHITRVMSLGVLTASISWRDLQSVRQTVSFSTLPFPD